MLQVSQVEAKLVSDSRNKIHQTWPMPFAEPCMFSIYEIQCMYGISVCSINLLTSKVCPTTRSKNQSSLLKGKLMRTFCMYTSIRVQLPYFHAKTSVTEIVTKFRPTYEGCLAHSRCPWEGRALSRPPAGCSAVVRSTTAFKHEENLETGLAARGGA